MRCPYCGSVVEPLVDAQGALVCPACMNTGRFASAQPGWAAAGPSAAPAAKVPGKLVAALVLGIASVVLFPIGLVLGPIAVVLAVQGRKELERAPRGSPGDGFATGGLVLGIVGMVAGLFGLVVLSSVFFVLVSNLGEGNEPGVNMALSKSEAGPGGTLTVVMVDAGYRWEEFEGSGSAGCSLPAGEVEAGDVLECEGPGDFQLLHTPSGTLLYATTFRD
jgi:hypothetical protein